MKRRKRHVPRKDRIREAWTDFATAVIPAGASEVQRVEMRRAFYGGAWAMLTMFMAIGTDEVSEDDGVRWLEEVKQECEAFTRDVTAGRA